MTADDVGEAQAKEAEGRAGAAGARFAARVERALGPAVADRAKHEIQLIDRGVAAAARNDPDESAHG